MPYNKSFHRGGAPKLPPKIEITGGAGGIGRMSFTERSLDIALRNPTAWVALAGQPLNNPSAISGEPATYLYETERARLYLTLPEISKLNKHELSPAEVRSVFATTGMFWQISRSFYDQVTGERLPPPT